MATNTAIPSDDNVQVSVVGNETDPGTQQEESTTQAAPPETEAESVSQPPESEGEAGASQTEQAEQAAKPSPYQERINKLTKQKYDLLSENEELKARLAGQQRAAGTQDQAAQGAAQPQKPPEKLVKPNRDDFETYEDYVDAASLYNAKLALQEQETKKKQAEETSRRQEINRTWQDRVNQARAKYDDFDLKVNAQLRVPQSALEAIIDSEYGPDIAYHIGNHPEVADKLLGLKTAAAVAREIGKIEAVFESEANKSTSVETQTTQTTQAPQTTGAPAAAQPKTKAASTPASLASTPVNPVNTGKTKKEVNLDELSFKEFCRIRNEQEMANQR